MLLGNGYTPRNRRVFGLVFSKESRLFGSSHNFLLDIAQLKEVQFC